MLREVAGYVLRERIGSGGMGDVYKAWHPGLQRWAAVKVLHQQTMADRFRNEALIHASVDHPNIARLYASSLDGPNPAIVMEFAEGESLDALICRKGRLPSAEALAILGQLADALSYLHARDIIHRDLKPQNFRVKADGTLKMLDFGIAKHKSTPKLTMQGFVVGTTEYMAPEQFRQIVSRESDCWSVGVMLYEMLTGHLPFESPNPVMLQARIMKAGYTDPAILVNTIPPVLLGIVEKTLRVQPSSRLTASAIRKLLGPGREAGMDAGSRNNRLPDWMRGDLTRHTRGINRRQAAAVIAVIAGALLLMLTLITGMHPEVPEPLPVVHSAPASGGVAIRINVPNVPGASVRFDTGETAMLPFSLNARDGQELAFTLSANGYAERRVILRVSNRRNSYDYNLDKLND